MSANHHLPITYPHAADLNFHSVNDDVFALNLSAQEQYTGEIKRRGYPKIIYIDAHLDKTQAAALAIQLLTFCGAQVRINGKLPDTEG